MRVAPVSADLLIKLAMLAAGVAVVVYVTRQASAAVSGAVAGPWNAAADAVHAVSPFNQENILYQTANRAVQAATGTDATLGTWLYDVTHPNEFPEFMGPPASAALPWDTGNPLQNDAGMNFNYF